MKILISAAVWGRKYAQIFTDYSLASMLAPGNLPRLAQQHEVVCHIMTTRKDGKWIKRQPAIHLLSQYARIDWDFLEDHRYHALPVGHGGEKYSFLGILQNIAIKKSLQYDALIFNYADFIWADGSLTNTVEMLADGVDAVLTFCLPADQEKALKELDDVRRGDAGGSGTQSLVLPSRRGADILLRCLHREGVLRYWDGPGFSVTPTYILWPVAKDGAVLRAYHQTILVLRVKPDDPDYKKGIAGGSLDGYFTTKLAENATIRHAADSDDVLVFSLYDTIIDSEIGGASRQSWRGFSREESLRECLRGTVSEAQRKFAKVSIKIRRANNRPERWEQVETESLRILEHFHQTTPFDPKEYERVHGMSGRKAADPWQRTRWQYLLERAAKGRIGRWVDKSFGPVAARALFATAEQLFSRSGSRRGSPDPFMGSPPTLFLQPGESLGKLWLRPLRSSVAGSCWAAHRSIKALLSESTFSGTLVARLIGGARARAIAVAADTLVTPAIKIAPNVSVSRRLAACFKAGISIEARLAEFTDLKDLGEALSASEAPLRAVVRGAPLWTEGHRALGRNYWFQGRHKEAMEQFDEGERCLTRLAEAAGWNPNAAVLLPRNTTHVIGLIGHIDGFVKHKIINGDQRPYYLLAPEHEIVNREFLDYWNDYITIVTDDEEISRLVPLEAAYAVNWNWVMPGNDGRVVHVHQALARAQREWKRQKKAPLLSLKAGHAALLAQQRAAWGMKEDDWFVCLHVRSGSFYTEKSGTSQHFRNTPIEDYYPLIRSILDAGGWVVRMGDKGMPPLDLESCGPHRGRVIDYAHAPQRSPELDVALSAACRLFVSSPSGLHTVAHAFGRPVCPVNYPIYAGFPWHPDEIFVPQRYFSRGLARFLTLTEILGSDLVHADQNFLLERAGVELVRDRPDDLVEAVREALNPGAYTVAGADSGQRVRQEFDRLNSEHVVDISGRLGLHFATTYAKELCPHIRSAEATKKAAKADPLESAPRRLDVVIPSFNRPARLHALLETGLSLAMPGVYFAVIDDGSTVFEDIPGRGLMNTEQVCTSFGSKRIVYIRNPQNMGVAASWQRYYRDFCVADYTMSVTDKDEFINPKPIISAIRKLDRDSKLTMVVIPLRQKDRSVDDRSLSFNYSRMSGQEYLARYVQDNMLQHASMWGVIRVDAIRKAGVPRSMNLRRYGLDDGFGIDIDFVFMVAALGDVDFESDAHVRRSTIAGGTERFPLTFAYTYYQYAKRAMAELQARGVVNRETVRRYMSLWILLICRGLVVAYRPVHGTELEKGTSRIRRHLWLPILIYLPLECLRHGVTPTSEIIERYLAAARLICSRWVNLWQTRLEALQIALRG